MKAGQVIQIQNEPATLKTKLGAGGQGEVWLTSWKGRDVALKLYYANHAVDSMPRLMKLANTPSPSPEFIWPLAFVRGKVRFGYVMPKLADGMVSFQKIYMGIVKVPTRVLVTALVNLCEAFRKLHLRGLSYNDLNLGGFFMHPTTGAVQIVDCDNVQVNDDPSFKTNILFPGFGAPEVVEGQPCNNKSDDHSLAVVIFHMLCRGNPLDGMRETTLTCVNFAAQKMLYGKGAVFAFNPTDSSNRPHPQMHSAVLNYWRYLHPNMKTMFEMAFVDGLHNPNSRPTERAWQAALASYRDELRRCASCGDDVYVANRTCPKCDAMVAPPKLALVATHGPKIVLTPHAEVYEHHCKGVSYTSRIAQVVQNPANPSVHGLKNLTTMPWSAKAAGTDVTVMPGRSLPISEGSTIQIGKTEWRIAPCTL